MHSITNRIAFVGILFAAVAICMAGCGRDVRLAGQKLRQPTVQTVSMYGITLDESATPEQVAFAALRAVRDDVRAISEAAREEALDREFQLCAANEIANQNRTRLSRDEHLTRVMLAWAPTISHYVDQFPTSWDEAATRLVRRASTRSGSAGEAPTATEVLLEVRDPGGDPGGGAVLVVWLVQDSGYWRVTHLGFLPGKRTIASVASAATPAPDGH